MKYQILIKIENSADYLGIGRVIGKIQHLCDLSYHVGHLILLGIQVQASGQGLRFCDLAHTRVHLLGLDRSGLAWLLFL